jgi:hypothetical protein
LGISILYHPMIKKPLTYQSNYTTLPSCCGSCLSSSIIDFLLKSKEFSGCFLGFSKYHMVFEPHHHYHQTPFSGPTGVGGRGRRMGPGRPGEAPRPARRPSRGPTNSRPFRAARPPAPKIPHPTRFLNLEHPRGSRPRAGPGWGGGRWAGGCQGGGSGGWRGAGRRLELG